VELQDGVPAYNVISWQHTDMSSKSASVHLTCVTFSNTKNKYHTMAPCFTGAQMMQPLHAKEIFIIMDSLMQILDVKSEQRKMKSGKIYN
jgi:hypothetical protein